VPLHHVHPPVDGEPFQHDDPPTVVDAGDQLAHPDAAELPVGQLRRGVGRGFLSTGHTEHRPLEHRGLDGLAFRRAGSAAGQDLECDVGFGLGMSAGLVTVLEPGDD
jgi:hypothetical protein